jgi:hypothetical protein
MGSKKEKKTVYVLRFRTREICAKSRAATITVTHMFFSISICVFVSPLTIRVECELSA